MFRGGLPIIIIGIMSIIAGILYTGGPYPLGYHGLGDLFAFIFFGPVAVTGTYYVQTLEWSIPVLLMGCVPGLFSVALLCVNNLRDIKEDTETGKRTLAVRFGATFVRIEFTLSIIIGSSLPLLIDIYQQNPSPNQWGLLTLIPALKLIYLIWEENGANLNPGLSLTSKIMLFFTIVWSMGTWY